MSARMPEGERLFVYGTLLPPASPASLAALVRALRPVGRGWLRGRLYDLGRYPGAVPDARAATRIAGEIFALPDDRGLWAQLDAYEGVHPHDPQASLFRRVRAAVELADERTLLCWVYAYNRDPGAAPLIDDGDYLGYRSRKRQQASRSCSERPTSSGRSTTRPNSGK